MSIRSGSFATIGGALLGLTAAYSLLIAGRIEDSALFHGTLVIKLKKKNKPRHYAITLGNIIIGKIVSTRLQYNRDQKLTLESSVLIHEYGHYLQSIHFKPLRYIRAGINSIFHNKELTDPRAWSERDASLRGLEFARKAGMLTTGFGEPEWPENLHRKLFN